VKILVINSGSSSQKSCLYDLGQSLPETPPKPLWEAQIDWSHHQGKAELKVKTESSQTKTEMEFSSQSREADTLKMLETLVKGESQVINNFSEIEAVGHRVVHGGLEYHQSTLINPEVKAAIARLSTFAPIHNPINLAGIETVEKILGNAPQVAVFDTAFHTSLAPFAYVYAGDYAWLDKGIRRYGFHGTSHQYCSRRATQILGYEPSKLINCHLGNGCSLAAIKNGKSIDTTMGFTPLDGLMMGTRSGSVDPGILIHLLRQENYTADRLDRLLNQESGLLGISGISGDMRKIMEAIAEGNQRAQLALDIYIHRLKSGIGGMVASLGGLDTLVFTAGVGENSTLIRASVAESFGFLGLKIDAEKNSRSPVDQDISTPDSTVRVLIIHTQEDWEIARECWNLLAKNIA
jgi:acetate kinase